MAKNVLSWVVAVTFELWPPKCYQFILECSNLQVQYHSQYQVQFTFSPSIRGNNPDTMSNITFNLLLNILYISFFIKFFLMVVYWLFLYLFYFHDIVSGTDGSTYIFPLHFLFWVYLSVHVFYFYVTLSYNILWHNNFHRDERSSISFVPIFEEIP